MNAKEFKENTQDITHSGYALLTFLKYGPFVPCLACNGRGYSRSFILLCGVPMIGVGPCEACRGTGETVWFCHN